MPIPIIPPIPFVPHIPSNTSKQYVAYDSLSDEQLNNLAHKCIEKFQTVQGVACIPLFSAGSPEERSIRQTMLDYIHSNQLETKAPNTKIHQFIKSILEKIATILINTTKNRIPFKIEHISTTTISPSFGDYHIDPSIVSAVLSVDGKTTEYS